MVGQIAKKTKGRDSPSSVSKHSIHKAKEKVGDRIDQYEFDWRHVSFNALKSLRIKSGKCAHSINCLSFRPSSSRSISSIVHRSSVSRSWQTCPVRMRDIVSKRLRNSVAWQTAVNCLGPSLRNGAEQSNLKAKMCARNCALLAKETARCIDLHALRNASTDEGGPTKESSVTRCEAIRQRSSGARRSSEHWHIVAKVGEVRTAEDRSDA